MFFIGNSTSTQLPGFNGVLAMRPRCLAVPIRCGTKIPIGACGKSGSTDQDGTLGPQDVIFGILFI